mgnify:CR=1 FL=1|tara:strand:- start:68384 stop:68749 length:366 start_codon:yes stop_codon:yes gene_type:complete
MSDYNIDGDPWYKLPCAIKQRERREMKEKEEYLEFKLPILKEKIKELENSIGGSDGFMETYLYLLDNGFSKYPDTEVSKLYGQVREKYKTYNIKIRSFIREENERVLLLRERKKTLEMLDL